MQKKLSFNDFVLNPLLMNKKLLRKMIKHAAYAYINKEPIVLDRHCILDITNSSNDLSIVIKENSYDIDVFKFFEKFQFMRCNNTAYLLTPIDWCAILDSFFIHIDTESELYSNIVANILSNKYIMKNVLNELNTAKNIIIPQIDHVIKKSNEKFQIKFAKNITFNDISFTKNIRISSYKQKIYLVISSKDTILNEIFQKF